MKSLLACTAILVVSFSTISFPIVGAHQPHELVIGNIDTARSTGTCFPVRSQKKGDLYEVWFLTTAHNFTDATEFSVYIYSPLDTMKTQVLGKEIIYISKELDVALFSVETNVPVDPWDINFDFEKWDVQDPTIEEPKIGTQIAGVGFPMMMGPVYSVGYIGRKLPSIKDGSPICSISTYFGCSGGPIFIPGTNRVIGILFGVGNHNGVAIPTLGFIVPIEKVHKWLKNQSKK